MFAASFVAGYLGASSRTRFGSMSSGTCSRPASSGALAGAGLGANVTGTISELALRRAIGVALLVIAAVFAVEALFTA